MSNDENTKRLTRDFTFASAGARMRTGTFINLGLKTLGAREWMEAECPDGRTWHLKMMRWVPPHGTGGKASITRESVPQEGALNFGQAVMILARYEAAQKIAPDQFESDGDDKGQVAGAEDFRAVAVRNGIVFNQAGDPVAPVNGTVGEDGVYDEDMFTSAQEFHKATRPAEQKQVPVILTVEEAPAHIRAFKMESAYIRKVIQDGHAIAKQALRPVRFVLKKPRILTDDRGNSFFQDYMVRSDHIYGSALDQIPDVGLRDKIRTLSRMSTVLSHMMITAEIFQIGRFVEGDVFTISEKKTLSEKILNEIRLKSFDYIRPATEKLGISGADYYSAPYLDGFDRAKARHHLEQIAAFFEKMAAGQEASVPTFDVSGKENPTLDEFFIALAPGYQALALKARHVPPRALPPTRSLGPQ